MKTTMHATILVILLTFADYSIAAKKSISEDDFKYCLIGGIAYSLHDKFIFQLALNRRASLGLLQNPKCAAIHTKGLEIGQKLSKKGHLENKNEEFALKQYGIFRKKIEDSILKNAGF